MHKQKLIQAVLVGAAITFSGSSWAVPSGRELDYSEACGSDLNSKKCLEYRLQSCSMKLKSIQEPQQSSQQSSQETQQWCNLMHAQCEKGDKGACVVYSDNCD